MIKRLRSSALGAILSFVILGQMSVGTAIQLTAVVSLPIVAGAAKCSKDQLAASAQDVLDVVTDQAIIGQLQLISPEGAARFVGLLPFAKDLVAAIKAADFSTALTAVNAIFPVVNEVAVLLHANAQQLAIVAVANIALHFIINHVQAQLPTHAAVTPAMRQAIEYGAELPWGCDYHRKDKRCVQ